MKEKDQLTKQTNGKVFVGLSGGVDSSVAALLLKNQGYDVVGVHLRCWNKNGCDEKDAEDAKRVADKLEIPFYVLDMEKEYKERVVDYMIKGYENGITPNPDVACNREIKFGLFLEKALLTGADYVATGHYTRLEAQQITNSKSQIDRPHNLKPKTYHLFEAKDKSKDQSYFLWTLTQNQLKHIIFPVGDLTKTEVRKIAKEAGLPTAEKKDSQGICFIGEVTLKDFLEEYLPRKRGNARTTSGEILGTHEGAHFFTIGQRHGLGISINEPYYVAGKDTETNTVILATRDDPALKQKEVTLADVNFVDGDKQQETRDKPLDVLARVRYRAPLVKAKLSNLSPATYNLVFELPQEFVAPGQSAVFYSESGELVGGGIII
ncbi:MAG: tRNA 2-thiouridine(34) synthase MnmA [Candidatus Colwellbacteria bacterium RIFCSPHIGHO2_02_FULL_45_17]|uniref:tRNA-specific 2-thiouridylase MnmA n=1 Tax=Candidatus Colwellbacteria bacterium RIFCSPLOWO2_02_FULL_45_11 TaxID=1797692 RepID=A0A1G1Z7V1_9BACT|nr:MAG: tRNA 2-thiouridine(34) synthase MnmA [Candidatus Colwellbacteria bacterium RIFCSPHIGHO2_02_FULL_45_17]OGY60594.1 MAG: tRNA 2-thiouridine(34) synthase MnmA [Candidatus Colwellbacteria bacterium RIFCSPLOWO2_02_FULL_45_11]